MTPFQQEYAPQLRDLLIGRARYGSRITYGEAAAILGIHHRTLRTLLGVVGHECQELGEPILTALVVNAVNQECGKGLRDEFGVSDPGAERQKCTEWWRTKGDEQTDDIDRRAVQFAVMERRPEQQAFRREIFKRYLGRCPLTGCELTSADNIDLTFNTTFVLIRAGHHLTPCAI